MDLSLFSSGVNLDGIRVLTEGKEMPVSELEHLSGQNGRVTVLETLYQLYRTGSTIALNALEQRWEPLSRLSAELSAETSARVQTNVYLTPGGGAQGLSPHYDTHDVCVLQVHGVKRWSLYGTAHELPLRDQPFDHSKVFEREVEQEIDLKPGDVLYLPRGTVHAATSTDSASVHIAVGFRPLLWNAVIQEAVNAVLGDDVRFRTGLPMGFANDAQAQKETEETLPTRCSVAYRGETRGNRTPVPQQDGRVRRPCVGRGPVRGQERRGVVLAAVDSGPVGRSWPAGARPVTRTGRISDSELTCGASSK